MRKLSVLLLVFCLVIGVFSVAGADGAPKFKKQPVTQTTDKKGTAVFTFRAVDFDSALSSWHFINPETGEDLTGPQLREYFSGVKGFSLVASNGKQQLTMKKVPDALHGWTVYVVLANKNGYTVVSDKVQLFCSSVMQSLDTTADAGTNTALPESITIRAENLTLMPLDKDGNPAADEPASVLTVAPPASVLVKSEQPVGYWTINGIVFQPAENIGSFILGNIISDLTVSASYGTSAETPVADSGTP